MSVESAKEFLLRLGTDETFREQIANAPSVEDSKRIAQEAGYNFTDEDYQVATSQILESASTENELSDEQLESVAGGALNFGRLPGLVQPLYGVVWSRDWLTRLGGS